MRQRQFEMRSILEGDHPRLWAALGDFLRFELVRRLRVPNDELWRVLGDFGTGHHWSTSLGHCERNTPDVRVGTARSCTLPKPVMGRNAVREVVTEFDQGRVLRYELEGGAGPFKSAASRRSSAPMPEGGTVVTVEGHFEPRSWLARVFVWPVDKPMVRRLAGRSLAELEAYVAGSVHPGST